MNARHQCKPWARIDYFVPMYFNCMVHGDIHALLQRLDLKIELDELAMSSFDQSFALLANKPKSKYVRFQYSFALFSIL